MDPNNSEKPFDPEKVDYWREVDLYIGGSEHATGHLLYARFWHKFLFDLGLVPTDEPFRKLINQGMILGTSALVYRINGTNTYVSKNLIKDYETTPLHVDVNIVENDVLDLDKFKSWRAENADAEFILEDGQYICGSEVEKMSKRWYNVVNPDDICNTYGADVLRMYEMFLGPLEQSKPWNTAGISGVNGFIKKLWRLFHEGEEFKVSDAEATKEELKVLHQTIGKVTSDIEDFSFNTAVSTFMICVNELQSLKCNKRAVLEPLVVLLSPYAPHIAEELWHLLGNENSVTQAEWPVYEAKYTVESSHEYPVMFNGKMRFKREFSLETSPADIEKAIRQDELTAKYADGKSIAKVIVVPKKIVNVVVK
jgi:leucyl-tRNA synthetase